MKHFHCAVIPADGIGPEVIAANQQVLQRLVQVYGGVNFAFQPFDWGSARYGRTAALMSNDGVQQLAAAGFYGIRPGSVDSATIPDHVTLWGLLLPLRQGLQYVNLRPMRLLEGVATPLCGQPGGVLDTVCICENSEGEYAGVGGRVHWPPPQEVAIQSIVFTRRATGRLMRFAFAYAQQHNRRRVTSVTKSNSTQHNRVFRDDVFRPVAAERPAVPTDQQLVDSMTARMVERPETVDVFVASHLFGGILTDLGAALMGSMGLAPSARPPGSTADIRYT